MVLTATKARRSLQKRTVNTMDVTASNRVGVFISYSHDSPEHMDRVLDLANRLRSEGIDAELDRYEDAPPEGWPRWCDRKIQEAQFVLVVCTETYLRRFEGADQPGQGLGAKWEGGYSHAGAL